MSEQTVQMAAIKAVQALTIASLRKVIPIEEIGDCFGDLHYLAVKHDIPWRHGGWYAIYHSFMPGLTDVEVGIMLPGGYDTRLLRRNAPLLTVRELPAEPAMACWLHRGHYGGMTDAYTLLLDWIDRSGYRVCGPSREIYHQSYFTQPDDAEPAPEDLLTEIQLPVKPV